MQASNTSPSINHQVAVHLSDAGTSLKVPQSELGSKEWAFINESERAVLDKAGKSFPTLENTNVKIFYGIKTGCTEAFVVDSEKYKSLIEEDSSNSQVLFKVLRGRDIGRYKTAESTKWLLVTKSGINVSKNYPSIAKYLTNKNIELEGRIENRGDQGSHWMNLRDCSYYDQIESEKIVWSEMSATGRFARSSSDTYIIDTAYMLITPNIEFLLGILNSKFVLAFMAQSASRLGGQGIRWKRHIIEKIPIPTITKENEKLVKQLSDLVLEREKCKSMDEARLESEIDNVVYKLYEFSESEIDTIRKLLKSSLHIK